MTPQRAEVQRIFTAAVEFHDAVERAAFLDAACGPTGELRAEVESLLAHDVEARSFIERPAVTAPATLDLQPAAEQAGTTIGPYKLIEQIGEGGMGTVWMAQQSEPVKRLVAVKLIKAGMDSRQVIARFEAERQALALMDHPNIARVLDAGTSVAGRPYFVMDLVRGVPITRYCDEHQLTPRQRLELFVPVCQAIQHAHQKGIIHRDLKPSNVLVALYDGRPVPKVIDFGVAKATGQLLTEQTLHTGFGDLVGTPEYMSPEQASFNNLDIDTRSDVYSLGVLLYELLAGSPPFSRRELGKAGVLEMLRVIREQEPTKPSVKLSTAEGLPTLAANRGTEPKRLMALVRGEVDWIVMKALEKDRNRRYESANSLAMDLNRYLADEVVVARPPSASYRFRKFVRRNRGPMVAASLILLALIGGLIGTGYGVIEARNQRAANELREQAEYLNYAHAVDLAFRECGANNIARALELLDSCPADLRGWEWYYVHRLCHQDLVTLVGHTDEVWSASFSADGKRVVTASMDGTARVWDAETGKELALLKGHTSVVQSASFSADGKRVFTASWDNTARVWDAVTGRELALVKWDTDEVSALSKASFSADGKRVVTTSIDDTARVWDVESGKELALLEGHTSVVLSASFSADGKRIVTNSSDNTARVWDAETGKELALLKGHTDVAAPKVGIDVAPHVQSASFSADGKRVVTAGADNTARVWDAETGKELALLKGHTNQIDSASFSADGKRVVTASMDGTARVWDTETGQELAQLKGHSYGVRSASFSADGKRVVAALGDNTVRVWDAETGMEVALLKSHTAGVSSASFSADGKRVVTASGDRTARVWDAEPVKELALLKGHTYAIVSASLSADGKRVVTASGQDPVRVCDAETGKEVVLLKGHTASVWSVSFSMDGKRVVTASGDSTAGVWDTETGKQLALLKGHTGDVRSASFSVDGMRVVTASIDNTARVWDAGTVRELALLKGHTDAVVSASFSADGKRVATGSTDNTARVWDAETGKEVALLKGHTDAVWSASFSADGKRVATGSTDSTARVWDAETGKELALLKGHAEVVMSASFSADGKRVVTASGDETVRVWDADTGKLMLTLTPPTGIEQFTRFSDDGTRILTTSHEDGDTIRVIIYDARPVNREFLKPEIAPPPRAVNR